MNRINFTASFVKNTTIKKKDSPSAKPENTSVAIVELDKNDENDIQALTELKNDWTQRSGKYIRSIYYIAKRERPDFDVEKEHYYAITTQKDNFDELNSDQVLGVMLFYETTPDEELNEIKYLEVEPSNSRTLNKERKYSGIGSRMVDFVTQTFRQKPIYVYSDVNAVSFYSYKHFTNREDNDFRSFYHEI